MGRLAAALLLALALPPVAAADEPRAPEDPPLCREVLAENGDDDPLETLRRAEEDRWRAARSASRRGKKLMGDAVGMGDGADQRRRAAEAARLSDAYRRALREARVLCGCRERRGDPYREDCERLFWRYRGALRPPPHAPDGPETSDDPAI